MATTEKGLHGLQTTTLKNLSKFFKINSPIDEAPLNNSRFLLTWLLHVSLSHQSHTSQVSHNIVCEYPESVEIFQWPEQIAKSYELYCVVSRSKNNNLQPAFLFIFSC